MVDKVTLANDFAASVALIHRQRWNLEHAINQAHNDFLANTNTPGFEEEYKGYLALRERVNNFEKQTFDRFINTDDSKALDKLRQTTTQEEIALKARITELTNQENRPPAAKELKDKQEELKILEVIREEMAAQVSAYREFAEQSNMKTTSSAVLAARQAVEAAIDATPHDYKTGNFSFANAGFAAFSTMNAEERNQVGTDQSKKQFVDENLGMVRSYKDGKEKITVAKRNLTPKECRAIIAKAKLDFPDHMTFHRFSPETRLLLMKEAIRQGIPASVDTSLEGKAISNERVGILRPDDQNPTRPGAYAENIFDALKHRRADDASEVAQLTELGKIVDSFKNPTTHELNQLDLIDQLSQPRNEKAKALYLETIGPQGTRGLFEQFILAGRDDFFDKVPLQQCQTWTSTSFRDKYIAAHSKNRQMDAAITQGGTAATTAPISPSTSTGGVSLTATPQPQPQPQPARPQ